MIEPHEYRLLDEYLEQDKRSISTTQQTGGKSKWLNQRKPKPKH